MAGWLLDHLWQSTLFAAAASLLALALRSNAAAVRYWVWFAAVAKFLVPFGPIAGAAAWLAARLHAQAPPPPRLQMAWQALESIAAPAAGLHPTAHPPPDAGAGAAAIWAAAIWAAGTMAILTWRAIQWRSLRRALADAAPLALPTGLPAVGARIGSGPALIGFLRPVLALPPDLPGRLTPAELEAVLEHEAQHGRRRDNLLALPLLLAEALFWFHPLIWWIGSRMLAERERACDEAVLRSGVDAETYARGLLEICRLGLEPPPPLGAAMGGANLKRRIRQIMADQPPRPLGACGGAMLGGSVAAAFALPLAAGIYTGSPIGPRLLADLAHPIAAAVAAARPAPPIVSAPRPRAGGRPSARPEPALVRLAPAPSPLADGAAVARPAEQALRLVQGAALPRFQPTRLAAPPSTTAAAAPSAEPSPPADLVRVLADRAAYVAGLDVGSGRLDLRQAGACPSAGVADAERRLGGQSVSTAFDGRVRRFVDTALGGRIGAGDLSPAMAAAVDERLPALRATLAAQFHAPVTAQLIGEDRNGREVYLARPQGGYVLVLVDDVGQIEAAVFCADG